MSNKNVNKLILLIRDASNEILEGALGPEIQNDLNVTIHI